MNDEVTTMMNARAIRDELRQLKSAKLYEEQVARWRAATAAEEAARYASTKKGGVQTAPQTPPQGGRGMTGREFKELANQFPDEVVIELALHEVADKYHYRTYSDPPPEWVPLPEDAIRGVMISAARKARLVGDKISESNK